ncbi:unnamed protein product, partial [Phaeothamnion confervicola]
VEVPEGYSLAQAVCSYGYFGLCPNAWVPAADLNETKGTFSRPLRCGLLGERVVHATVSLVTRELPAPADGGGGGSSSGGSSLRVELSAEVDDEERNEIAKQIQRMLRTDLDLTAWFVLHPGAAARGFGRLFRSPTLFEDMVKTITNCNVKWSGTVRMNKLLCSEFGKDGAFPTPHELAAASVEQIRERGKVGYRDERILLLARAFVSGAVDFAKLDDPTTPR